MSSGSPAKALPPRRCGSACRPSCAAAVRSSRQTQNTAASNKIIAAISRLTGPSGTDNPIVITGPSSAPAVPPAPMKPNKRLPWSAVNRSAMNDQNTATANRLKTATQT